MKKICLLMLAFFMLVGCSEKEEKENLTLEDIKNQTEAADAIIEEAKESARIRSVEAYVMAIETSATTYVVLNDVEGDITICTKDGNVANTCIIDASPSAKDGETIQGERAVIYSGDAISCEKIDYNRTNGKVNVTNCVYGDEVNYKYSGNLIEGIKRTSN